MYLAVGALPGDQENFGQDSAGNGARFDGEEEGELMVPRTDKFNVLIRSTFHGRMFSTVEAAEETGYSLPYARDLLAELYHLDLIELVQAGSVARHNIWRVVP